MHDLLNKIFFPVILNLMKIRKCKNDGILVLLQTVFFFIFLLDKIKIFILKNQYENMKSPLNPV